MARGMPARMGGPEGKIPYHAPENVAPAIHQEIDALSAHAKEPRASFGHAIPKFHPLAEEHVPYVRSRPAREPEEE
jgi:hypothetical protein